MGLRSWIARSLGLDSPVVKAAVIRSSTVFDSLPLKNHLSEDTKRHLANTLFQRIQAISVSPDPIAACRNEFCGCVIEYAKYQD
jgi:hypothetical protein